MPSKQEWENVKNEILSRIGDFGPHFALENIQDNGGDWVSGCCPFHEEANPSFSYNRKKGFWKCHAGCGKGSFFDFVAKKNGVEFKDALKDLAEKFDVPMPGNEKKKDKKEKPKEVITPPIPEQLVDTYHTNLMQDEDVRRWLEEKRGLTPETLKEHKIGWDAKRQRNTIPVRDEHGRVRNLRLYNRKKDPKIISYTDGQFKYGSPPRLLGEDRLAKLESGAQVIVCEGEWDCILLQQNGFNAVSGTGGCNVWRREWMNHLEGKKVVVMYDVDEKGRFATSKYVLPKLRHAKCEWVKDVKLPLKGTKEENDVTDYFNLDHTAADLQKLIDNTPQHEWNPQNLLDQLPPIELKSFNDMAKEKYVDKRVRVKLQVCGETSEEFHAVESFRISHCTKMEKNGNLCVDCLGSTDWTKLPRSSREFIGSCMTNDDGVRSLIKNYICNKGARPVIKFGDRVTVREFFAHQPIKRKTTTRDKHGNVKHHHAGIEEELNEKKLYYLAENNPPPTTYWATGWVKSHPKTQQITMLIEHLEPIEEDFESFDPTEEKNAKLIREFGTMSLKEKMEDLCSNVTRIYDRFDLHNMVLLTYCSPLWIPFLGDVIRGWIISCVIGDAGTGKTQTAVRIAEFAQIGDIFSGLTGSRTGLSYGLSEHPQKGWQVKIGRYPANNRKLLLADEIQLVPAWELRTLSKAMEEGYLQIDRIKSHGYASQTRMLMIANPNRDKVLDSFTYGCESLSSIFPPTIIRRTDLAVFVGQSDVKNLNMANLSPDNKIPQRVTSEMLRAVILWSWKMNEDNIYWEGGAEDLVLSEATRMSGIFGHAVTVPLVTISDFRNKIARVAAAYACVSVSLRNDNLEELLITKLHVKMACIWMASIYGKENCQLDEFSEITHRRNEIEDYDAIKVAFLRRAQNSRGAFERIIWALRISDAIRRDELEEQADCDLEQIKNVLKLLRKYTFIESTKEGYVKRPRFNKFLRRFMREEEHFFDNVDTEPEEEGSFFDRLEPSEKMAF